MARAPFRLAGVTVQPGRRETLEIPLAGLYTHTPVTMPAQVVHGRRDGPVVFVSGAVHGDEINGVEIVRRLLRSPLLRRLQGTLVAVPIVNVYGFHNRSRYLPDRRDLNRSFPGFGQGSLASRLAHTFMQSIVAGADLGIDLHTAAINRDNLPQIRADLNDPILAPLARAFGAPVLLHSASPEGSLRRAAADAGIPVMVYEAGEALRFDETAIRIGLRGVVNVLRSLGMLAAARRPPRTTAVLRTSTWVRAGQSGILRSQVALGAAVAEDTVMGVVADPFGERDDAVTAPFPGIVIGRTNLPLVFEGEGLFHVGRSNRAGDLEGRLEAAQAQVVEEAPEFVDEPPIV
jgi:hypothetical protein